MEFCQRLRRREKHRIGESRLWGGDVLSFLHAQAQGRTHLRRLHGHRVLCERRGQGHLTVQGRLQIKAGETTPDNRVSLLTARCIGACGIAPAVVYDGTVTPRQSPETALEHLKQWEAK